MPTITEQPFGLLIELDHGETQEIVKWLENNRDPKSIGEKLVALGVSAVASPYVAAALALHLAWEIEAMKLYDKGQGVFLTYPLYGLLAPGVVIPTTRHVEDIAQDWSSKSDGTFTTAGGDTIDWHIDRGAGDPEVVKFILVDQCGWDKAFVLRDGQGSEWTMTAKGHQATDNTLWAQQVHNHQGMTFRKPGFLGIWYDVFSVANLEELLPGDEVTFTWTHD